MKTLGTLVTYQDGAFVIRPNVELGRELVGRFYVGDRDNRGYCHAWVEDHDRRRITRRELRHIGPRRANGTMYLHSPTGFEVGYPGSGPADLALAIVADATRDRTAQLRRSWPYHQKFKSLVIAKLPKDAPWRIDREDVVAWVRAKVLEIPEAEAA